MNYLINMFIVTLFSLSAFQTLNAIHFESIKSTVTTLEGPGKIQRNSSDSLDIYCHKGKPKNVIYLWKSVKLHLEISSENFLQYHGFTPEDTVKAYKADRSVWMPNIFSSKKPRVIKLDPFNSSCVAIKTDFAYIIELKISDVDYSKVALMAIGVFLFIFSRSLGENVLFFYLSGISLGVFASFMIVVYFLSKMLPGKPVVYSAMIGGWTLGMYALQLIWSNFQPLIIVYRNYFIWYILIVGFLSFGICYKMGPPKDKRNRNLITWTLQAVGLALIYFSTDLFEMFVFLSASLIILKVMPLSFYNAVRRYWTKRFPPKLVLLTTEEYYIQGQVETAKALEELRGYCSSPECPQWKLMLKLKNPQKLANFVETKTHLSDEEITEYETSDFIIKRKNISNRKINNRTSFKKEEDLTSEDSSLSSEDY